MLAYEQKMALEAAAPHHAAAAKLFEAPDGFRGTYEEVARAPPERRRA